LRQSFLQAARIAALTQKKQLRKSMQPIRVIAIPTKIAEEVRSTLRAPVYGFPAHVEPSADAAPCRHCLRLIAPGNTRRILFTYDRFSGIESLPQPGPVYIHADNCPRYAENAGFPEELRHSPRTLEAFARGRRLVASEYVKDGISSPASPGSSHNQKWTTCK
jgi:hypothetical protein